jgi:hypothetical protein
MKALLALLVFLTFATWIAAGIVAATTHGNPWLLLTGAAAFTLSFARFGCVQT